MMKLSTCAPAVGGIWTVRVIEKLLAELEILKGGAIGLLGLASKPRRIISGRRRPLQSPVQRSTDTPCQGGKAQDPVPRRAGRGATGRRDRFCDRPGKVVKAKAPWSRPPNGLGTATCRGKKLPARNVQPRGSG